MSELATDQILIGESSYEQALDLVIERAKHELLIFDQDLTKGAYASLKRYELIRGFLAGQSHSKLIIILQKSSALQSSCPRLFNLLQIYTHKITIYQTSQHAESAKDTFLIADKKHYVRRFHIDQARFKYNFDDIEAVAILQMRFDELLQATSHTVSITTLGL